MPICNEVKATFNMLAENVCVDHYRQERRRDQDYSQGIIEERKRLGEKANAYRTYHKNFLKQVDDSLIREIMPYLAFAQEETKKEYKAIAAQKGIHLTKEQHPTKAGVCDSGRTSQFAFGKNGDALGEALALQQPDGVIVYHKPEDGEKTLTFAAASFFELTHMKHIDTVTLIKDAFNPLIEAAYYHYATAAEKKCALRRQSDRRMEEFIKDPYVQKYIKESEALYTTVAQTIKEKGFGYYESSFGDNDEAQKRLNVFNLHDKETTESDKEAPSLHDVRFIRAMQIQQILDEQDVLEKSGYGSDRINAVFQDRLTKRQYLWNPGLKKFDLIPDIDKDNPIFNAEKERFEKNLSQAAKEESMADELMAGARQYRRFFALKEAALTEKILQKNNVSIVSCSDSRTPRSSIVYTGSDLLGDDFRNPGAFISRCGQMMSDAGRFFAVTRLNEQVLIISPHAVCGAEEIIDSYFEGNTEKIPTGFQHVAEHRRELVETVLRSGEPLPKEEIKTGEITEDDIRRTRARYAAADKNEIIDGYRKKTGINVRSFADCLSVQQLLTDIEVAEKEYPTVPRIVVFQNVSECRNYIYNPKDGKFLPILAMNETFPLEPSGKKKQVGPPTLTVC